jgi:hypothetical protein
MAHSFAAQLLSQLLHFKGAGELPGGVSFVSFATLGLSNGRKPRHKPEDRL